jgi:peptide/nickel transport system permease protein
MTGDFTPPGPDQPADAFSTGRSEALSILIRLARRLAWAGVTLLGTVLLTFLLLHGTGADPARLIAGPRADPQTLAIIRTQFGLDQPLWVQIWRYVEHLLSGDWGISTFTREPVLSSILQRFPATLELAAGGLFFYLIIGIPLGAWTACHRNGWQDRITLIFGILIISLPIFYLARMLQYGVAYHLRLLPVAGIGGLSHLILPAFTLGLVGGIYYSRLLHASLSDTLQQDYIRFARSRGIPRRSVLIRHALRNALVPVATQLGMDVAGLLGGVIFTENVFSWPGIGTLMIRSIFQLDVPMILGTVLFSAILVVAANIIVDLLYPLLDPRMERAL